MAQNDEKAINRRDVMRGLGSLPVLAAGSTLLPQAGCRTPQHPKRSNEVPRQAPAQSRLPVQPVRNQPSNFDREADRLLDDVRERASHYFVERADPETGIVFDRAPASGHGSGLQYSTGSISATGFGLSALCVAAQHGYVAEAECERRILLTLAFLAERAPNQHGFFPHYLDARTGVPASDAEYSSIDTALLVSGALHARKFLNSARAEQLSTLIYERVEWPWMLASQEAPGRPGKTLAMGWQPGAGFLRARWDSYSECTLMYLLAIGSPTHPLAPECWAGIERSTYDYGGIRFISSFGALFIHQYLHVWADIRGLRDGYTDYWENSISAVRAHKTWCMLQHCRFPWVDERVWGFSASDTSHGTYSAWAAPPVVGDWDGTLAPHAAGGSLTLLPEESIVVLKAMREHYPQCFSRYGYVNAFRPRAGRWNSREAANARDWFDSDVIANDLALTMLMAENQRTGSVRSAFMRNAEIHRALELTGFQKV